MDFLYFEKHEINKVIDRLNKNGWNLPRLVTFTVYVLRKTGIRLPINNDNTNIIDEKEIKKLRKEYYYLINEHVRNILMNIDTEKATKVIVKEKAKDFLDLVGFFENGFVEYINKRVFEIDMSHSVESIMYKLIFEWYDLSENKRRIYREISKIKAPTSEYKTVRSMRERVVLDEYDLFYDENE